MITAILSVSAVCVAQSGRNGDFFIGDVAIHVTTAPGEAVIGRCRDNIDNGHRPIIVTTARGLTVAEGLEAIDAECSRRAGSVSRNTWITEAVTERLARLASSSRPQGAGGANG